MPLQLSRLTLVIERAEAMRFLAIPELTAFAAGIEICGERFRHPALPHPIGQPFDTPAEALEAMWDLEHGYGAAEANPEVVVIAFRALARNIRRLVPGLGHGGVR